jgi:uncharacterized protein YdeI (YjbR/CyaY-like superfamily)
MGKKDKRVDAYIEKAQPFAQPIMREIRDLVHATCPDVEETMKWSFPHFDYQGIMCSMASFKEHCAFGFWKGSLIKDADGNGLGGDAMGSFGRITKRRDLPSKKVLTGYIKQAMALNEAGVKSPTRAKPKPTEKEKAALTPPPDFAAALKRNAAARKNFDDFSYSHRKEYIQWITDAKREETRANRIAKAVDQIAEGKSQNWKYAR